MEEIELKNIEFYEETEFKETEIGPLPKDWGVMRLEYIVEKMKAGGTPSTNISEYWNGDIPLVKVEDVVKSNKFLFSTNLYITNKGLENSSAWLVPENSIILTMYGTPGEVCINKIPVAVTQNVMGIVKNEKITIDFFYYVLKFAKIYTLHLITDRTIFTHFTLSKAKNLKIPLPPLSEQQKIAAVLSAIQEAKEKTERVIEATKNLKKSLMKHLFTYGPVPLSDIDKVELKETEIGPLPTHWQVVRFAEVTEELISGDWGEEYKKDNNYIESYVIRGTDFNLLQKGIIDNVPIRFIKISSFEKRRLSNNDILIELSGGGPDQPTGRVYIYNFDSNINICFSNFVKKIKVNNYKCLPFFYYLYWKYLYELGKTLIYEKRTTGIRNFKYKEFLENEYIPLPPLPEQQKIAEILSSVDEKIQKEEERKRALENLFKSMLHNLMTGKIRIKKMEV